MVKNCSILSPNNFWITPIFDWNSQSKWFKRPFFELRSSNFLQMRPSTVIHVSVWLSIWEKETYRNRLTKMWWNQRPFQLRKVNYVMIECKIILRRMFGTHKRLLLLVNNIFWGVAFLSFWMNQRDKIWTGFWRANFSLRLKNSSPQGRSSRICYDDTK